MRKLGFKSLLIALHIAMAVPAMAADGGGFFGVCRRLFEPKISATETNLRFKEDTIWALLKTELREEILAYRRLNEGDKENHLKQVSDEVLQDLQTITQSDNIGLHFNLHGGAREGYLSGGGIHANRGDVGTGMGFSKDFNSKVYFFQSREISLFEALNTRNPYVMFSKQRMGNVLIVFDLNAPEFQQMRRDGVITAQEKIYYDYSEGHPKAFKNDDGILIGVPKETFILPPMRVFENTKTKIEIDDLTWEEQSLVTLRFIQAYLKQQYN